METSGSTGDRHHRGIESLGTLLLLAVAAYLFAGARLRSIRQPEQLELQLQPGPETEERKPRLSQAA